MQIWKKFIVGGAATAFATAAAIGATGGAAQAQPRQQCGVIISSYHENSSWADYWYGVSQVDYAGGFWQGYHDALTTSSSYNEAAIDDWHTAIALGCR